jgi:hypothetical protein
MIQKIVLLFLTNRIGTTTKIKIIETYNTKKDLRLKQVLDFHVARTRFELVTSGL